MDEFYNRFTDELGSYKYPTEMKVFTVPIKDIFAYIQDVLVDRINDEFRGFQRVSQAHSEIEARVAHLLSQVSNLLLPGLEFNRDFEVKLVSQVNGSVALYLTLLDESLQVVSFTNEIHYRLVSDAIGNVKASDPKDSKKEIEEIEEKFRAKTKELYEQIEAEKAKNKKLEVDVIADLRERVKRFELDGAS